MLHKTELHTTDDRTPKYGCQLLEAVTVCEAMLGSVSTVGAPVGTLPPPQWLAALRH
jgi:hypothetical protein